MSDNIVKHSQLKDIAGDLWDKAKKRDITALEYETATKTIKGKNNSNPDLSISAVLSNLASIDERTSFKKDVSVDTAGTTNNLYIGEIDGDQSQNRILGYRNLTSSAFVDGYVSELIVYAKSDLDVDTLTTWHVWAIKKEATKEQDTVKATYHQDNVPVKSITINGNAVKCVRFAINQAFSEAVYFMARCTSHQVKTCIPSNVYKPDVVNMSVPPGNTIGQTFQWNTNEPNNTAIMHLVGRESISSLAEKIRNTQADSSKYVLQSETTNTGGDAANANQVVRLGSDGKLNANMLPAIAVNEYFTAPDFTQTELAKLPFQNGDVVVVTKADKTKRYLCIDKDHHLNDLTNAFVELNSKDGIITSVNSQTPGADGNVTVTAEHIKITASSQTNVKQELDKKISNITLNTGDKKKLTVTKADNITSEVDLTEAFKAENISYTGTIGGVAKNHVKEAIDALITENGKAVKKVSGCAPGEDGNIVVTAKKTDANIALSFGTGGTDVELFSYMTTSEVEQIKALFT